MSQILTESLHAARFEITQSRSLGPRVQRADCSAIGKYTRIALAARQQHHKALHRVNRQEAEVAAAARQQHHKALYRVNRQEAEVAAAVAATQWQLSTPG